MEVHKHNPKTGTENVGRSQSSLLFEKDAVEDKINAKFNLTKTDTATSIPELYQFDLNLDARLNGARTTRIRILELSERRRKRAAMPSAKQVLAPEQALFQARLGDHIRFFEMMMDGVIEEIPVTAFYVNINVFMPQIIEFARQSADTAEEGHPICGDDWRALVSACESFAQLPFTFAEAFCVVGVLRWCEDHKVLSDPRISSVPVSPIAAVVESEYLARLESILQTMAEATKKDDRHAIIASILQVRTNLVLDAYVLSYENAIRIGEIVSQIAAIRATIESSIKKECERHKRGIIDAVLTENWRFADDTIADIDNLTSIPHVSAAFDVYWDLTELKARRVLAFVAFLFVGNDVSGSTSGGDDESLPRLRQLFNALQAEYLPIRDVNSLTSVYQTNDLRQYLQLAGRTTGKDALLDAIKIAEFVIPFVIDKEGLARDETVSFLNEVLSDPDSIYFAKLISNWFLPPFLLSGITFPEDRYWQPFFDSLCLVKSLKHWDKFGGAFCRVFSRAVDLAYPNHSPILIGHVLNIYPDVVELYGSVPTETDEMVKILKELYGQNGERFRSRLQGSRLHVLAEMLVDRIEGDGSKRFLRRCYEQAGFIVTDEFCDQLDVSIGEYQKRSIDGGVDDEKGLREFEEKYKQITSLPDRKEFEKYVSREALKFVEEITNNGYQLFDGQKRFVALPIHVKKTLTTERDRIYAGSTRKLAQYDWYLICRRIVFAMSRKAVDGPTLAPMIGYAKRTSDGKVTVDLNRMRSLLTTIGLGRFFEENLNRPERDGGRVKPEEEDWMKTLPLP